MLKTRHMLLNLAVAVIMYANPLLAQGPDTLWTRTYGMAYINEMAYSVQQASDGGYIVTGSWDNERQICLMKTDADGDTLWTRKYGESGIHNIGYSVCETNDGAYVVTGRFSDFDPDGDVCLIKTDADGDSVWMKLYGTYGEGNRGRSVQQTTDGGYIIACHSPCFQAQLIKTDSAGDSLWQRTLCEPGGETWPNSVQQTSDGGYIVAGYYFPWQGDNSDVYLMKLDAAGDSVWSATYGGSGDDEGYSVQETSYGGYIIVGYTQSFGMGYGDVYLIKTDANGNTDWTRTYGGPGWDCGYSVRQTPDDGYIIAGFRDGYHRDCGDVYVIKTDCVGDTLWTRIFRDPHDMGAGRSVEHTADGGYIIAGNTGMADPDGHPDFYLIRLGPDPDLCGVDRKEADKLAGMTLSAIPNPSGATVRLRPSGPIEGDARMTVYDLLGREIRVLTYGDYDARLGAFFWDGTDSHGHRAPPGVYFIRLQVGDQIATRKVVLVR